MSCAIEFQHVSKKFKKGEKFDSLRDFVPNLLKSLTQSGHQAPLKSHEFWAVKNVNFRIEQGEVVGVMGPNGAGKSTILKLLSGIMSPTTGKIHINGRLSALIEVTAGFHPELTGRENVYLNGTILGMRRREIDFKFDKIVAFSEVGEFIDTPVKHYSSGMYSRLGFSVAAHMDPEILIVDEVLSVGDVAFQSKCAQKMRELLKGGATILLVSHQISLIQSLCKRVLLLDHGQLIKDGATDEVMPFYQNITFKKNEEDFKNKLKADQARVDINKDLLIDITNVSFQGYDLTLPEEFKSGQPLGIHISYKAKREIVDPIVIIDILRSDGVLCCSLNSKESAMALGNISGEGSLKLIFKSLDLVAGIYLVKISFWDREMIHAYVVHNNSLLRIAADENHRMNNGVFFPHAAWTIEEAAEDYTLIGKTYK